MGGIGSQELLIIILIGLIFFGAKRLPEIARGIGKGMSEFKKAARDIQTEINREVDFAGKLLDDSPPQPPASPEMTDPAWESPYPGEPTPPAAGEPTPTAADEPTPPAAGEPSPPEVGEPTSTATGAREPETGNRLDDGPEGEPEADRA